MVLFTKNYYVLTLRKIHRVRAFLDLFTDYELMSVSLFPENACTNDARDVDLKKSQSNFESCQGKKIKIIVPVILSPTVP